MTPTDIKKPTEARQVLVSAIASFDGHIAESLAPLFECIEEKISAALEAKDAEIERLKALVHAADQMDREKTVQLVAAEAALNEARGDNSDLREALEGSRAAWRELDGENKRLRALLSKQDSGGRL